MVYKKRLLNRADNWQMLDKLLILKDKNFYKPDGLINCKAV